MPFASKVFGGSPFGGGGSADPGGGAPIGQDNLILTVGGVNVTPYYEPGSLRGSQSITRNGRLDFRLNDHANALSIPVGAPVVLLRFGEKIFAGSVERVREEMPSEDTASTYKRHDVSCVDHTQLAAKRLITAAWDRQPAGDIVRDLVELFLEPEGVKPDEIDDGPDVGPLTFEFTKASLILDRLAKLTGFAWWIDEEKVLHFKAREEVAAPFAITDVSDPDPRSYLRLTCERTRTNYRNVHVTRGGKDLGAERTRAFVGDGETSTFTLEYPVGSEPTIRVNGVPQTVGIRGVHDDSDPAGFQWFWQKGDASISQNTEAEPLKGISQDSGSGTIVTGDLLEVSYRPLLDLITTARDGAAIADRRAVEGGTGIYEASSSESQIESAELALAFGEAFLRQHARINCKLQVQSFYWGWKPGQTVSVSLSKEGISGEFLIEEMSFDDQGGDFLSIRFSALDNESDGGWPEFYKKLADATTKFSESKSVVSGVSAVDSQVEVDDAGTYEEGDHLIDPADDPYTVAVIGSAVVGEVYLVDGVEHRSGSIIGPADSGSWT